MKYTFNLNKIMMLIWKKNEYKHFLLVQNGFGWNRDRAIARKVSLQTIRRCHWDAPEKGYGNILVTSNDPKLTLLHKSSRENLCIQIENIVLSIGHYQRAVVHYISVNAKLAIQLSWAIAIAFCYPKRCGRLIHSPHTYATFCPCVEHLFRLFIYHVGILESNEARRCHDLHCRCVRTTLLRNTHCVIQYNTTKHNTIQTCRSLLDAHYSKQ